jgi:hypothetical protein
MEEVGLGLTGMDWNGGSLFGPYWNIFEWMKLIWA